MQCYASQACAFQTLNVNDKPNLALMGGQKVPHIFSGLLRECINNEVKLILNQQVLYIRFIVIRLVNFCQWHVIKNKSNNVILITVAALPMHSINHTNDETLKALSCFRR